MAKFFGKIGYINTVETAPGVWEEETVERMYRGDVIRYNRHWQSADNLNDNINLNNAISIVADSFAFEHIYSIRYVEFSGSLWKVTNIEIQRPRLILTIGGVYNGEQA